MYSDEVLIRNVTEELFLDTHVSEAYAKLCGYLPLEWLFTTEHVYAASWWCASGYWNRFDTMQYMKDPWDNSRLLAKSVCNGTFKPRYYKEQTITERGKKRNIRPPHFDCKVVQKVLCAWMLRPLLARQMICTSYAAVRGRGTALMRDNIVSDLNHMTEKYGDEGRIVLCDFEGYFASFDLDIYRDRLNSLILDPRVIDLIFKFYDGKTGLTLGDELSQIPASWFPSTIDHTIKDRCGVEVFHRYMDDSLVIVPNILDAYKYLDLMKELCRENRLVLKAGKIKIIQLTKSFEFCKEHYVYNRNTHKYHAVINPEIIKTEKRKLKFFGKNLAEVSDPVKKQELLMRYNSQYRGWHGMIESHPGTRKIICDMDELAEKNNIGTGGASQ